MLRQLFFCIGIDKNVSELLVICDCNHIGLIHWLNNEKIMLLYLGSAKEIILIFIKKYVMEGKIGKTS